MQSKIRQAADSSGTDANFQIDYVVEKKDINEDKRRKVTNDTLPCSCSLWLVLTLHRQVREMVRDYADANAGTALYACALFVPYLP